MPDGKFRRQVKIIVPLLSTAVVCAFVLAAYSFYSAHRNGCASRNQTLDVLHDVLVLATTPAPEQRLSIGQKRRVDRFRRVVFARIDKARC